MTPQKKKEQKIKARKYKNYRGEKAFLSTKGKRTPYDPLSVIARSGSYSAKKLNHLKISLPGNNYLCKLLKVT